MCPAATFMKHLSKKHFKTVFFFFFFSEFSLQIQFGRFGNGKPFETPIEMQINVNILAETNKWQNRKRKENV